jgi:peptidoglycan lytic transglycosylase
VNVRAASVFLILASLFLAGAVPAPAQPSAKSKRKAATTSKKKPASRKHAAAKPLPPTELQQTFTASANLKPMAWQLLEGHQPAAYKGVEAYARKHEADSAGSLAWLVLGDAYLTDNQPQKAIAALTHAQTHAGELGDYADYLLAQALQANGEQAAAAHALVGFDQKYPTSLLRVDAALVRANALLAAGEPAQAAAVLEGHRTPARADIELALGRAYVKAGKPAKAAESYRLIYYTMPMSPEADVADTEGRAITGAGMPAVPYPQRRQRAELLVQGRQYAAAAEEYGALMDNAPSADLRGLQVAYGTALYKAGRYKDARLVLEGISDAGDEIDAQRLFYLSEMSKSDAKQWVALVNRMRDATPASQWLSEALYAAGNRALLHKDYASALSFYQETWTRNPQGKYASYTHWKTAWLTFRMNKRNEARRLFEGQITDYAGGLEVPGALYWRARMAEEDNNPAKAKAYYLKLIERYQFFYYGALAVERLKKLAYAGPPAGDAVLAKVQPVQVPNFSVGPAADNVRVQKARVLENGALFEFAIRELQAAGSDPAAATWAQAHIARIYLSESREYRALQVLKRAIPGYYSYDIGKMPRPLWEILFPKPYWTELTQHAAENNLDPFLVAALIRQESEFNPSAVSHAKAMGLMQLLPSVGRKMARQLKLRGFTPAQLTVPDVNLQLGAGYFREVLDQYGGQVEYALAAYNAGGGRVDEWRGENYRDIDEFVESIPFTETREYVQAVTRNAEIYRRLYGTTP